MNIRIRRIFSSFLTLLIFSPILCSLYFVVELRRLKREERKLKKEQRIGERTKNGGCEYLHYSALLLVLPPPHVCDHSSVLRASCVAVYRPIFKTRSRVRSWWFRTRIFFSAPAWLFIGGTRVSRRSSSEEQRTHHHRPIQSPRQPVGSAGEKQERGVGEKAERSSRPQQRSKMQESQSKKGKKGERDWSTMSAITSLNWHVSI